MRSCRVHDIRNRQKLLGIGAIQKVRQQTFHSAIKRGANDLSANDRGAALLVAIGILAVLLVISVTFFRMTTMESQVANNYANSIQAELGVDAAIAIAIHELQKDAQQHPAVTSSDHAWRSKFNGTWAVGKSWTYGAHIYGAGYSPDLFRCLLYTSGAADE